MKRKFINKIVAGIIVSTTMGMLSPIPASAEWVNDYQGNWYYQQENQKLIGWNKIDGNLYYFDGNGKMLTGWTKAGDSWYYLDNNGVLKTGWINYNKNWYYADSTGVIQSGVINIAGKVYIFESNGVMKTSNMVIDGEFYTIGADGEVVGGNVPTPDKEFDGTGNLIKYIKNTDKTVIDSPVSSQLNNVITDQSHSDDDPNTGRIFSVSFRDSTGAILQNKNIKYNKSIDLYDPTKVGYKFVEWNTRSDGSGKSYSGSDTVKVKENLNLYAQWTTDSSTYVTGITISGGSSVARNGTIQLSTNILPSDATNKNVTWSVVNGTGQATINSNGVLTGVSDGTVTVKATAADGSNISTTKDITVSETQILTPVTNITVTSKTGATAITTNGGTLQMIANVLPTNADNSEVTWSVENGTGAATIDSNGLVTAISNGTVKVKATANDGSGVVGGVTLTLSGQSTNIPISSITITGKNSTSSDVSTITEDGGTLQMSANIVPTNASNQSIEWTIILGQDKATISSAGVLKAVANGIITVQGKTQDGTGIVVTKDIVISGQKTKVTGITVNGGSAISTPGGALQMTATVNPSNATDSSVTWSVENGTGSATIDANGLLKAASNGSVKVKATANDGSGVFGTTDVNITGQSSSVPIQSITVTGKDGVSSIDTDNGTLQMIATILPSYATTTSPAVTWAVSNGSGTATISSDGVLKAVKTGAVTVVATSVDNPSISGSIVVYLSGQFTEVTQITVSTANNVTNPQIVVGDTLQMQAVVNTDATYKNASWQVLSSGTNAGTATINSNGILTAISAGQVEVIATSTDQYAKKSAPFIVNIIPKVLVTQIDVNVPSNTQLDVNGVPQITQFGETLQMSTSTYPAGTPGSGGATNTNVDWSVTPYSGNNTPGTATISSTGLLVPVTNGDVIVKATAKDGSNVVGSRVVTISGQPIKTTGFTVKGYRLDSNGNSVESGEITSKTQTMNMDASVLPTNATTTPTVVWSVGQMGDTGTANINSSTGVLTPLTNGTVTVKATAVNDSSIYGGKTITINMLDNNFNINSVSLIANGVPVQLSTNLPASELVNKTLKWSIVHDSTGTAAITEGGMFAPGSVSNNNITVQVDIYDSLGKNVGTTQTIIHVS